MPYKDVGYSARNSDGLAYWRWLKQLERPWRPIQWKPENLIGGDFLVGTWALNTFPTLELTSMERVALAEYLVFDDRHPRLSNLDWLHNTRRNVFSVSNWIDSVEKQHELKNYMQRVLNTLLPPSNWTWEKRWTHFGKDMPLAISAFSDKHQTNMSGFHGAVMAALLHEAPPYIQTMLCAFKRMRHPNEPVQGHPDAQLIRHYFFAEPTPTMPSSALVNAALLFANGIDPDIEVDLILDMLVRDPNTPAEMYSLDGLTL